MIRLIRYVLKSLKSAQNICQVKQISNTFDIVCSGYWRACHTREDPVHRPSTSTPCPIRHVRPTRQNGPIIPKFCLIKKSPFKIDKLVCFWLRNLWRQPNASGVSRVPNSIGIIDANSLTKSSYASHKHECAFIRVKKSIAKFVYNYITCNIMDFSHCKKSNECERDFWQKLEYSNSWNSVIEVDKRHIELTSQQRCHTFLGDSSCSRHEYSGEPGKQSTSCQVSGFITILCVCLTT